MAALKATAAINITGSAGADTLTGAGIYYGAAYTEAMNYKDQDVFVVGGANSAAQRQEIAGKLIGAQAA